MTNSIFNLNYPELIISNSTDKFPVHRIYCVGQNYMAHTIEMGGNPNRDTPFFFSKPADAACQIDLIPWPQKTDCLHHEVELVVALKSGGTNINIEQAKSCIYGYAVGVDLTRRDLQATAKTTGRPWDTAKGFDNSAPMGHIVAVEDWQFNSDTTISLSVNDIERQQSKLSQLIWTVPELLVELSTYYNLKAGDLIFTGTPAGVSALEISDEVKATIDGLPELIFSFEDKKNR